jgi:hypothetical protein
MVADNEEERDVKIVSCRGGREPSDTSAGVFFAECLDLVSGEIASNIFGRLKGLGCAAWRTTNWSLRHSQWLDF